MRFYLKWINPIVALAVLGLCSWLWLGPYFFPVGGSPNRPSPFALGLSPFNLELGHGFGLYFFAKGLFCSAMLFIAGEFLKRFLAKDGKK